MASKSLGEAPFAAAAAVVVDADQLQAASEMEAGHNYNSLN